MLTPKEFYINGQLFTIQAHPRKYRNDARYKVFCEYYTLVKHFSKFVGYADSYHEARLKAKTFMGVF